MTHYRPGEAEALYQAQRERRAMDRFKQEMQRRIERSAKKAAMSEDEAEAEILRGLKRMKNIVYTRIRHGNERAKHEEGVPDYLCVLTVSVDELVAAGVKRVGIPLALEIKGADGKVSGNQYVFLEKYRQAGALAGIAKNFSDVHRIIREFGLRGVI